MDALKMLPMVSRLTRPDAEDGQGRAVPGSREEGRHARRAADPQVLARRRRPVTSRCRWSSPRIPKPACATSAPTACRCSTAARPACTGSGTRAARSTTASPSGWASGSRSPSRSAPIRCCRTRATAPMPEGLDELLLAGFLAHAARRDGQVRDGRSRSAGQRADRARGLRRAGRAAARRAVRRSHRLLLACPTTIPVFHLTCITHAQAARSI